MGDGTGMGSDHVPGDSPAVKKQPPRQTSVILSPALLMDNAHWPAENIKEQPVVGVPSFHAVIKPFVRVTDEIMSLVQ